MIEKYEMIYIAQPNLGSSAYAEFQEKIQTIITSTGGQVIEEVILGQREVPHECNGYTHGHYTILQFLASPEALLQIQELFTVTEALLRRLVIRGEDVQSPILKPEFGRSEG